MISSSSAVTVAPLEGRSSRDVNEFSKFPEAFLADRVSEVEDERTVDAYSHDLSLDPFVGFPRNVVEYAGPYLSLSFEVCTRDP